MNTTSPLAGSAAAQLAPSASVRNLPVNLFASVMGISGLALAWRAAHRYAGFAGWIAEAASALAVGAFIVLAAAYTFKALRYRAAVVAEFNHPILGNFFGTIVISLLLLSAVVQPYAQGLSQVLWSVGTAATFALAFVVVSRLVHQDPLPKGMTPSLMVLVAPFAVGFLAYTNVMGGVDRFAALTLTLTLTIVVLTVRTLHIAFNGRLLS